MKEIFVVCPKECCNALYKRGLDTKFCTFRSFNKVCGTALGYNSNLAHGRCRWKPYKLYEFTPPSSTLKKMFCSKEFNTLLDRNIMYSDDIITDFQDGQIWREFSDANFFDCKYNIGLMLNVDWFRPFKQSEYKVAGIMLTVLNLPREERFKKKWTILAGTFFFLQQLFLS